MLRYAVYLSITMLALISGLMKASDSDQYPLSPLFNISQFLNEEYQYPPAGLGATSSSSSSARSSSPSSVSSSSSSNSSSSSSSSSSSLSAMPVLAIPLEWPTNEPPIVEIAQRLVKRAVPDTDQRVPYTKRPRVLAQSMPTEATPSVSISPVLCSILLNRVREHEALMQGLLQAVDALSERVTILETLSMSSGVNSSSVDGLSVQDIRTSSLSIPAESQKFKDEAEIYEGWMSIVHRLAQAANFTIVKKLFEDFYARLPEDVLLENGLFMQRIHIAWARCNCREYWRAKTKADYGRIYDRAELQALLDRAKTIKDTIRADRLSADFFGTLRLGSSVQAYKALLKELADAEEL